MKRKVKIKLFGNLTRKVYAAKTTARAVAVPIVAGRVI